MKIIEQNESKNHRRQGFACPFFDFARQEITLQAHQILEVKNTDGRYDVVSESKFIPARLSIIDDNTYVNPVTLAQVDINSLTDVTLDTIDVDTLAVTKESGVNVISAYVNKNGDILAVPTYTYHLVRFRAEYAKIKVEIENYLTVNNLWPET